MIAKKVFFLIFLFLLVTFYANSLAQVDTSWVARYNGPADSADNATALAIDTSGNIYVTGGSWGGITNFDYATIKYNPQGETVWVRRYNGLGNYEDFANDIAVDLNGDVYVTGYTWDDFPFGAYNYTTIKYSPNGDTIWVRRYNGPGDGEDVARSLAVDDSGNVYVTGWSIGIGTSYDYATIKYSPGGDTLWVRRYNGPGNDLDWAQALAVNDSGNVYVTGTSDDIFSISDYATIKYESNGDTLWVRRYNGPVNNYDRSWALAVDGSGNVYVTGDSWGGITKGDYATVKYDSLGNLLWERRFNGSGNSADIGWDVKVEKNGKVYVTGGTLSLTNHMDYGTIKYNPNGDTNWVRFYNGLDNLYDVALKLALDTMGNVYVTGSSVKIGQYDDYLTVKYDSFGNLLWTARYKGPGNAIDQPADLALDRKGNLVVTGSSDPAVDVYDYTTIKYIEVSCTAKSGDADDDGNIDLADIIFLINYIFKSGTKPDPVCRADVNVNGRLNLSDAVYLVNYIFKSGSPPQKFSVCCL